MNPKHFINRKNFIIGILASGCIIAVATLMPSVGCAQADNVKAAMSALKAKTAALGAPKIGGSETLAGKDVPVLYFGTTKMNNFFGVVDEVVKENGGIATLFAKAGDDYVRVATTGKLGTGTVMDPTVTGPVFAMIKKGQAYYGEVSYQGQPFVTGYEPIKDASGNVIGIYYVAYKK